MAVICKRYNVDCRSGKRKIMCCRAVFINPYPVGADGKRFAFKAAVAENDDVFKLRTVEKGSRLNCDVARFDYYS